MPTDIKADTDTQSIPNKEKGIGREARKWLFRSFTVDDRSLNYLWPVGVMSEVLTKTRKEMPNTDHEQCKNNYTTELIENLPQLWPYHCQEKRRKKQRDRCEYGTLTFAILTTITLQHLINKPIPFRLHGKIPGALRMRIV